MAALLPCGPGRRILEVVLEEVVQEEVQEVVREEAPRRGGCRRR